MSKWAAKEIEIVKNNLDKTNEEIQRLYLPQRSIESIRYILGKNKWHKIRGRQWSDEETKLFIELYPNSSFEDLSKIFIGLTKSEYSWMRDKFNLHQSKSRESERRKQNGTKTKTYFSKDKKDYLISLYNNNDLESCITQFLEKYPMQNNKFLINYLFINNLLRENDLLNLKRLYLIYDIKYLSTAFACYKQTLSNKNINVTVYSKEHTKLFFKYWLKINNKYLSRNELISLISFRDLFRESRLDRSISNNFKHYYEFIQYVFPQYKIHPWELGVQVPNKFWENKYNVYWMIREGIKSLIANNIIKQEKDVILLPREAICNYFNILAFRMYGYKELFCDYFKWKNIALDYNQIKLIDNQRFDSLEEMSVYNFIKNLKFDIRKYPRKDKLFNIKYNESYIPDYYLIFNNIKIIIEYFGLYYPTNTSDFINTYVNKTHRKNEFYHDNEYYYIDLYPEDIKDGFKGVENKLTSFFINKLNINLKEVKNE